MRPHQLCQGTADVIGTKSASLINALRFDGLRCRAEGAQRIDDRLRLVDWLRPVKLQHGLFGG